MSATRPSDAFKRVNKDGLPGGSDIAVRIFHQPDNKSHWLMLICVHSKCTTWSKRNYCKTAIVNLGKFSSLMVRPLKGCGFIK